MSHAIILGIDRVAATGTSTIWHSVETIRDGRLREVKRQLDTEAMALEMAGVVWPQAYDNDCSDTSKLFTEAGIEVATHKATLSPSGRVLGIVGTEYEPVKFSAIFAEWYLALARAGGVPESLGTFDAGSGFMGALEVCAAWRVPGDDSLTEAHCNITSAHSGGGIRASFSGFRVICRNTTMMHNANHDATTAADKARRAWVTIMHRKNAAERMQDAVKWIKEGRQRAETEKQMLERLASKVVSTQEVEKFISKYISTEQATPRATAIRENQREQFRGLMRDTADLGNHSLGWRGITAYGLLQSVTRFEDEVARINATDDTVNVRRAFRKFLGDRELEKQTAREYIEALV